MELSPINKELDSTREIEVFPPANESFLDPSSVDKLWPKELTTDPVFLQQLETHREINQSLDKVIDNIPGTTTSLEDAVKNGQISQSQVETLYNNLSDLLEDEDYARLALYLPFEFLPNKSWRPEPAGLAQATERFKQSYLSAWLSLLHTHDVRANYVDGDVLEVEQRTSDLPRVVKAAHLIPKLVEAGMLEIADITALMNSGDNQILKNSITDALAVLGDMTNKEITQTAPNIVTFESIRENLDAVLTELDAKDFSGLTSKRITWLRYKKLQEQVRTLAEDFSESILLNSLPDDTVAEILAHDDDNLATQVLIEGLQKAIETTHLENPDKAWLLYKQYQATLSELWERGDPELDELLEKSLRRLYRLGLIDRQSVEQVGIKLPVLSGVLSENLNLITDEVENIKQIAAAIETNPELSSMIYPAVLVYGSRLKGYGAENADIDLAVFVKPGVEDAESERLRQLLRTVFNDDGVIEFWLDEQAGLLKVKDSDDLDLKQGESSWAHVLFGAAWIGDNQTVDELHQKILTSYFYETDREIHGRNARKLWLEEIERDTLQYRLLHKGYERHYPMTVGITSPHSDAIDGKSVFWDSGYRQLATRLFVDKVFLPKLSR